MSKVESIIRCSYDQLIDCQLATTDFVHYNAVIWMIFKFKEKKHFLITFTIIVVFVVIFQQLLRHTDMEHPDYYYIEMSLERLGSFLTELNDSIELSMKVVTGQATPKPRRWVEFQFFGCVCVYVHVHACMSYMFVCMGGHVQ